MFCSVGLFFYEINFVLKSQASRRVYKNQLPEMSSMTKGKNWWYRLFVFLLVCLVRNRDRIDHDWDMNCLCWVNSVIRVLHSIFKKSNNHLYEILVDKTLIFTENESFAHTHDQYVFFIVLFWRVIQDYICKNLNLMSN